MVQRPPRRNRSSGELAFYRCYSASPVPLATLMRVARRRWTVEETFQAAKGLAGLDEHQVRRLTSWRRWVTLAMLCLDRQSLPDHSANVCRVVRMRTGWALVVACLRPTVGVPAEASSNPRTLVQRLIRGQFSAAGRAYGSQALENFCSPPTGRPAP